MSTSITFEWLSTAIAAATRSAKFCVSGSLPATDPAIDIENLGVIKLPLKRAAAKELIAHCHVAPFGKGTQTLVNTKVRKTFELDPGKFRLSDEWDSAIARSTQLIAAQLGLPAVQLEANPISCSSMKRVGSSCHIATAKSSTGWWPARSS